MLRRLKKEPQNEFTWGAFFILFVIFSFFFFVYVVPVASLIYPKMSKPSNEYQIQRDKIEEIQKNLDEIDKRINEIEKSQNDIKYQLKTINKISGATGMPKNVCNTLIIECKKNNAPLSLMLAVYEKESHFNANAFNSSSQATGLGQILPSTARGVCSRSGEHYLPNMLKDPEYNIKLTTYYMMHDVYYWRKDWHEALYVYSGGSSSYANDVLEKEQKYKELLRGD